jgi:hypothetical protein
MNTPIDPATLAMKLASANALAFVTIALQLTPEQRLEFVQVFLAALSGMAEHSIGHDATAQAFRATADMRAVAQAHPLQ